MLALNVQKNKITNGSSLLNKVAIIGKDNRTFVPQKYKHIASGIGLLVEYNGSKGNSCTAFCVAPNIIATNAHCVVRHPVTRRKPDLSKMFFILPKVTTIEAISSVGSQKQNRKFPLSNPFYKHRQSGLKIVDPKQPSLSVFSGNYSVRNNFKNQSQDWGIAKLASPVCKQRTLSFETANISRLQHTSRHNGIFMIGFHGDRSLKERRISHKCIIHSRNNRRYFPYEYSRAIHRTGVLIPHTCDSFKGSSGSPILMDTERGAKVVGINLGSFRRVRYTQKQNLRTGQRIGPRKIQSVSEINMAVLPREIIIRINRFQDETILSSLDEFSEVQTLLKKLRLYNGVIDGLMGPRTRAAIERFEAAINLPELGLPTQQLLVKLRASIHDEHIHKLIAISSKKK